VKHHHFFLDFPMIEPRENPQRPDNREIAGRKGQLGATRAPRV